MTCVKFSFGPLKKFFWLYVPLLCLNKSEMLGLPGGPVVKNSPSNAGDMGSISHQGTKIPHAMRQLRPCATTREAVPQQRPSTARKEKEEELAAKCYCSSFSYFMSLSHFPLTSIFCHFIIATLLSFLFTFIVKRISLANSIHRMSSFFHSI